MKRLKVVLLGPSGLLGTEIQRVHAHAPGGVQLLPVGRDRLDLARRGAVLRALGEIRFDALVNCAGQHSPDAAEAAPARTFRANAHAVADLAALCDARNARFVHVSADAVFGSDPLRSRPWREDDATGPVNVLGASLALGETLAEQAAEDVTIVRVGPLFGMGRDNWVESIIRCARQGEVRAAAADYVSPTAAADAAHFILRLLADGADSGKYHVVNGGAASRLGLATTVARRLGLDATIHPAPRRRARPSRAAACYRVLDNLKASARFGTLPPWQEALDAYLAAQGHLRETPCKPRRWLGGVPLREGTAAKPPFLLGLGPTSCAGEEPADVYSKHERVGFNTGNLAFAHAIDAHLGGGLPALPRGAWAEANRMDGIAVMPAANQLGEHTDYHRFAQALCDVSVPTVLIGLGAQTASLRGLVPKLHRGTVDWVRQIAEHAPTAHPNIGVRGSFARYVLDRHGLADYAEVLGCPSLFINPHPRLGERIAANIRPPERIAVVAGNPHWRRLGAIEASLAQLVAAPGAYVVQNPLALTRLADGEAEQVDKKALAACRDYVRPASTVPQFVRWMERHGRVFYDIPRWLAHYRNFDLVVGTRIHGTILGLQAGVPSLCIVHDARMLELCETLKVPHVRWDAVRDGLARDALVPLLDFDAAAFDANRQQLCARYVAFLKGNGLPVADWLERLAEPAAAAADHEENP